MSATTTIVAIAVSGGVIISVIAIIAEATSKRGVGRKELTKLQQDISQIKDHINDIREQLADIIIRLN